MIEPSERSKAIRLNYSIKSNYYGMIYEYDLIDAGLSIIKKYELVNDIQFIKELERMKNKVEKHKTISKIPFLAAKITKCLKDVLRDLYISNEIMPEEIISVKRDAVFLFRQIDKLTDNEYIKFRLANSYTGFTCYNNLEFFLSNSKIDIKGNPDIDSDNVLILFITRMFYLLSKKKYELALEESIEFKKDYLEFNIEDIRIYRTIDSRYTYIMNYSADESFGITDDEYARNNINQLNIMFNYNTIIIPTINYIYENFLREKNIRIGKNKFNKR